MGKALRITLIVIGILVIAGGLVMQAPGLDTAPSLVWAGLSLVPHDGRWRQ